MIVSSKHRDIRATDHWSIIIFTGLRDGPLQLWLQCCLKFVDPNKSFPGPQYKVDNFLEAPAGFESCQWLVAFSNPQLVKGGDNVKLRENLGSWFSLKFSTLGKSKMYCLESLIDLLQEKDRKGER